MMTLPTMDDLAHHIIAIANNINKAITNLQLQKVMYYAFKYAIKHSKNNKLFKLNQLKRIYKSGPFSVWEYGPVIGSIYEEYKKYGSSPITEFARPNKFFNKILFNSKIISLLNMNPFKLVDKSHKELYWQQNKGKRNINYRFKDVAA